MQWGMAVLTKVAICTSLEYGFVSLTSFMRKTIIELVAGTGSRVIRYANVDLAWPADPGRQRKQVETAGEKRKLELSTR